MARVPIFDYGVNTGLPLHTKDFLLPIILPSQKIETSKG